MGGETDVAMGSVLVAGLLDGGTVALTCCLVLLRVCTMAMILSMTLDFLHDTMASPSVLPSGSFSTVAGLPSHIHTSATTTSLAFPSSDSIFTSAGCTTLEHPRSTLFSSSSIFPPRLCLQRFHASSYLRSRWTLGAPTVIVHHR